MYTIESSCVNMSAKAGIRNMSRLECKTTINHEHMCLSVTQFSNILLEFGSSEAISKQRMLYITLTRPSSLDHIKSDFIQQTLR